MASREEYYAKLKDPRWQQQRLRIFERGKWMCQYCGSTDKTLHVHHIAYNPAGGDPWDGSEELLVTACESCHEGEHQAQKHILYAFQVLLARAGIRTSNDLFRVFEKVTEAANSLCAEHAELDPRTAFSTALGMAIQEWPDDRDKLMAAGIYFRKLGPGLE